MLTPFKMGLGGKIGNGKQYFSWVHIDDVISAFSFLVESQNQRGTYNLTAPNPVTNEKFTEAIGRQLKRPSLLPMPAFVAKLLFGEMGETLLLNGQRVVPNKIEKCGFKFKYPQINESLGNIVK
jgi:uncharacterized protein